MWKVGIARRDRFYRDRPPRQGREGRAIEGRMAEVGEEAHGEQRESDSPQRTRESEVFQ
jgi:hypothetical protein